MEMIYRVIKGKGTIFKKPPNSKITVKHGNEELTLDVFLKRLGIETKDVNEIPDLLKLLEKSMIEASKLTRFLYFFLFTKPLE